MVLKRIRGAIARRRQGISLRIILVVPFVVQLCLAVGATSWLSWHNGQRLIQDSAFALQEETGLRVKLKLTQDLETLLLISRLNGEAALAGRIDWANLQNLEEDLFRQLMQFGNVSGIWVANAAGEMRAVTRQGGFSILRAGQVDRPGLAGNLQAGSPQAGSPQAGSPRTIPVTTAIAASTPPLRQIWEQPEAVRQAPWYRSAVQSNQLVWSPIFPINAQTGDWLGSGRGDRADLALNVSQPLYNRQTGALEGVVSSGIHLSVVSQFLSELGLSQTGRVFVIDSSGFLVAASDLEQPLLRSPLSGNSSANLSPNQPQSARLPALQSNDPLIRAVAQQLGNWPPPPEKDTLRQWVLNIERQAAEGSAPGAAPTPVQTPPSTHQAQRWLPQRSPLGLFRQPNRHFVSVVPLSAPLEGDRLTLNWHIVLVVPEQNFSSQIRRNTRTTLALSGAALVGAIALGLATSDWLARPILRLSRASQAIARGDLNQTLVERGPIREVATLAQSFNQMSQKLRQAFDNLETKVDRRTRLLRQSFEFEATLKRLTDRVRDSLNEDEILHRAVEELAIATGVRGCNAAIYDLERRTSTVKYEYTTFPKRLQGGTLAMDNFAGYRQLLAGQYFQHCGTIAVPSRGRVAMLACPMLDDQGVLGDLWLIKPAAESFDSQEIRLVQQVANQCAIAIRQARLYQAAQTQVTELARINQLKDDFLSTVSHELRTPMATMKMAIQMLEIGRQRQAQAQAQTPDEATPRPDTPPPDPSQRYFQILKDECQRESRLIDNLLDLSRLDIQSAPPQLSTLEPRRWLRRVVRPYQEQSCDRLRWQLFLPSYLPLLQTDARYLERILMELLDNACKYTPDGECITVSVQLEQNRLSFSVGNSGVEIPPLEQRRIFERFYRIPNSDPWKHGGTGLGLALVRQLTEQLGGKVQVESSRHHSLFTVSFPLSLADE